MNPGNSAMARTYNHGVFNAQSSKLWDTNYKLTGARCCGFHGMHVCGRFSFFLPPLFCRKSDTYMTSAGGGGGWKNSPIFQTNKQSLKCRWRGRVPQNRKFLQTSFQYRPIPVFMPLIRTMPRATLLLAARWWSIASLSSFLQAFFPSFLDMRYYLTCWLGSLAWHLPLILSLPPSTRPRSSKSASAFLPPLCMCFSVSHLCSASSVQFSTISPKQILS